MKERVDFKELFNFFAIWFDNFKKHTFKVDTGPMEGLLKGFSRLDADLKEVIGTLSKIEKSGISATLPKIDFPKIEIPKRVEISNFPRTQQFPESIEISNFPKFPQFPTDITVSNFPPPSKMPEVKFPKVQEVDGAVSVKNQISLEEVIKGLQTVVDVINDLRLEIPKSFSAGITTSTSMASKPLEYNTNNVDTTSQTNIVYIGEETKTGVWMISKINTASGVIFTYATPLNNNSIAGYSQAWSARLSLTYNIFSTAK